MGNFGLVHDGNYLFWRMGSAARSRSLSVSPPSALSDDYDYDDNVDLGREKIMREQALYKPETSAFSSPWHAKLRTMRSGPAAYGVPRYETASLVFDNHGPRPRIRIVLLCMYDRSLPRLLRWRPGVHACSRYSSG